MDKGKLLALADAVEKLTGPDRSVDGDIYCTLGLAPLTEGAFDAYRAPAYTASLDAAMTLVPQDYDWAVFHTNGGLTFHAWCGTREDVFGETTALALCAAALRAQAGALA